MEFCTVYLCGNKNGGAVVYFVLEPGCGNHTDNAEEIVYVIDGTVEATLGNKKYQISSEPHNFRNAGSNTAKMIRFFSSPNTVKRRFFLPLNFKEFPAAATAAVTKDL